MTISPSVGVDIETVSMGSAIIGTVVSLVGTTERNSAVDDPVIMIGQWLFYKSVTSPTILGGDTFNTTSHTSILTLDPFSEGGIYGYGVEVYTESFTVHTRVLEYIFNASHYPPLVVLQELSSGECGVNEVATLTGNVSLLPNTATNYTLTYTWTGPDGQPIPESSGNLTVSGGILEVGNLGANAGTYILTSCLDIPGTSVMDHCSNTSYPIFTDG